MIVIKNHKSGFSLIEVVIAVAMIGTILTSIYALQHALLKRDFLSTGELQRMLLIKNVLYDPSVMRDNPAEELKKDIQIKEPKTAVTVKKVSFKNKALKDIKTLDLIRVRAAWESVFGAEIIEAGILSFNEPKKDKKKK